MLAAMPATSAMGASQVTSAKKAVVTAPARGTRCVTRAQQQPSQGVTRRQASLAGLAAAVLAANASPAHAIFGLGEDAAKRYADQTGKIISEMQGSFEMQASDPAREERLRALRANATDWVSHYRRDPTFAGRPSFSYTYSAVNALTGQLNSFGYTSNIPKKRLERIQKELSDADKQLQRGR